MRREGAAGNLQSRFSSALGVRPLGGRGLGVGGAGEAVADHNDLLDLKEKNTYYTSPWDSFDLLQEWGKGRV